MEEKLISAEVVSLYGGSIMTLINTKINGRKHKHFFAGEKGLNLSKRLTEVYLDSQSNKTHFEDRVTKYCDDLAKMLIEKNKSYGDSVANPINVFSKMKPIDQINVRIDDKISRIKRGNGFGDDNDELDLIGYLVLKQITE